MAAQSLKLPLSPLAIAQRMEAEYGVGSINSLNQVNSGSEGLVFFADCDFGGATVVKIYDNGHNTDSRVESEARLYAYLNEVGRIGDFGAPHTILTQNGQMSASLDTDFGHRRMLLMERTQGQFLANATISGRNMHRVGAALANMHGALSDYAQGPDDLVPTIEPAWYRNWGAKRLARSFIGKPSSHDLAYGEFGFFPALMRSPNAAVLSDAQQEEMKTIDPLIAALLKDSPLPERADLTLIHNDLKPEHVSLSNDRVYFIDWGGRTLGPVTQDLGIFLLHLWSDSDMTIEQWHNLRNSLLEGYSSAHHLEEYELASVRVYIIDRAVGLIQRYSEISMQTGHEVGVEKIVRTLELMKRLLDE